MLEISHRAPVLNREWSSREYKYVLEMEKVTVVSDEMREVVESEWPELAHKLPAKKKSRG